MTPERWQQVDQLFHAALACEPAQRSRLLDNACDGDEPLRLEVESLIAFHEGGQSFIENPAGDVAAEMLDCHKSRFEPGEQIDNFRIVRELGSGGMGEVYLADDARLDRKIALKFLPPQFTIDARRVRRFEQEARAVSALNHPNIVTLHEIGKANSTHFIATEFIDGVTLREHMANGDMTFGEVLDVAAQVASALAAAHEAGIVHRDIKPENIMLRRDGFVKVLDFGLAKLAAPGVVETDSRMLAKAMLKTDPGILMGTVQYMSPEQARGQDVDRRTDIWSVGVVLYEMLIGRVPFDGETPSHVIVSILESELSPLSRDEEVPAEFERIIAKALQKDRMERYQTAGDMALDLKRLKEDMTIEARLKQFRRSEEDGEEAAMKSDGYAALDISRASRTSTSELGLARLTTSAEYVVNGIRSHKGSSLFASTMALLLVASIVYFSNFTKGEGGVGAAIDSVAVLSFVNESGNSEVEYLADGISESVIDRLARIPGLRVISLIAVLRYKGQKIDPGTIGRDLNVRAVLVGRITQRGDTLAISTELVDVKDNRRLWGGHYDRKRSDVLALDDEIAGEIAEKLRLRPGGAEKQRQTKRSTESTDAYDAYLRGRFMLEKRTGPATYKSIEYLEQAIKLDPNYALAYATLSYAYWSLGTLGVNLPKEEVLPKAKAAVAKALEIDDKLAEAHTALGHVRLSEGNKTEAERAFKRALELNPNSGFAHSNYSDYLRNVGRIDEAVAESIRAVELEPTSVLYNRNVAINLYYARRYDEAIEQSRKTLELDPNMPTAYRWLAKSYEQKKLYDQAVEAFLKTAEFGPEVEAPFNEAYVMAGWKGFWRKSLELKQQRAKQKNISVYALAETYVRLGEKDQAFAVLEKANRPMSTDPFWDHLRSDPHYLDLVRRMGLDADK